MDNPYMLNRWPVSPIGIVPSSPEGALLRGGMRLSKPLTSSAELHEMQKKPFTMAGFPAIGNRPNM